MTYTLGDVLRQALKDHGWGAIYHRGKVAYGEPGWPSYCLWIVPSTINRYGGYDDNSTDHN